MRKTCLDFIYKIAKKNKKVVFIGSDLGAGVLNEFKKNIPSRFFMEGVSEQFLVGMASGMAKEGFIPYVNTIATFLTRRCYEQIVVDVCLHNLPVRLIANGGGTVYAPLGPTHQAIEDVAILRVLPKMSIFAVSDKIEMQKLMLASIKWPYPMYIRLARGGDKVISFEKKFEIGKNIIYKKPGKYLIVSTGVMTQESLIAAQQLKKKGINCGVLHVHTLKPFDKKNFLKQIKNVKIIITVEEHVINGGLGSIILETISETSGLINKKILRIGLKNEFIKNYGSQQELFKINNIDAKSIEEQILKIKDNQ